VRPTQPVEIFGIVSRHFLDIYEKFCIDRPGRTPPSGESNARGVANYSDFGPIEGYLEMV